MGKTLSDKRMQTITHGDVWQEKDIKDTLKQIEFKLLKKFKMASMSIMKIIKEELGEKLSNY